MHTAGVGSGGVVGTASRPGSVLARLGTRTIAVLLFVASALVYASNGRTLGAGDTIPARLLPIAVLLDGSVMLDRFADEIARRVPHPYFAVPTEHGLASFYPLGAGLVATPILAAPILVTEWREKPDAARWMDLAPRLEKAAATVIAAAGVAVFFAVAVALGASAELALLLAATFAFGSQAFSTSSQALWQHGPGTLAILVALWCVAGARAAPAGGAAQAAPLADDEPIAPRTSRLVAFSAAVGVAFAVRPTHAALVLPFVALVLRDARHSSRALLAAIAPAAALAVAVVAYNLAVFGHPGGVYGLLERSFDAGMPARLAGLLVSPGRGLLVYFPATLVLLAVIAADPRAFRSPFAIAALAGATGTLLVTAGWRVWWGGHSFGPRLLTEIQPVLLLALACGLVATGRPGLERAAVATLLVLLPLQVWIQTTGTFAPPGEPPPALAWNFDPVPVDVQPDRNWDWRDSPIARGLARR